MGNLSSLLYQQVQTKTVNKQAFDYYKRPLCDSIKLKGMFEVETDDFSKIEDIRQKLLALPDQDTINKMHEDVIVALDNYLNENKSEKIILSQTDYFVFKTHSTTSPLLSIKNTQAEVNRKKLYPSNMKEHFNFSGYYVASCDLSKLWKSNI